MLQGQMFGLNDEVIAGVKAYLESKAKSFYKKSYRKIRSKIFAKKLLLYLVRPGTYW